MNPRTSFVSVTDQFCGAGGSSLGATLAGADVRLAMNHWKLAIETHSSNFPDTEHVLADVSQVNPRRYPTTDILITSPECTNHSLAKGAPRKNIGQLELWGNGNRIDPAEERSRATMWDVPRFAEYHNYRCIIVENVVDARYWRLFDAWLHAMHLLDYEHEIVYFNSMFAHPTPQSRDRMYVVFWKRGNKRPDLKLTPRAYCHRCERDVESYQSWKKAMPWGRYRKQYVYRCPECHQEVEPYYYAAANAIDWSDLGERIGDRAQPLKPRTLERIRYGLEKYGRQPMTTQVDFSHSKTPRTRPVTDELPTQSSRQVMALAVPPYLVSLGGWGRTDPPRELTAPMPTQIASETLGLTVPPFLLGYYTRANPAVSGVEEPVPTLSTQPRHYVVTPPPFIVELRHNSTARAILEALATVTAGGGHHGLVVPFLTSYYSGSQGNAKVTDPVHTVTATARHGLVIPEEELRVEDCYFRMLQPGEIGRAMAFPDEYVVLGSKRDQVRQYGNAVTPPVLKLIMERCMASFA